MLFHLMIVDDEPTIRKGLSHFIPWETLDCTVDATASDGQEAIEQIKENPPDIVITDIRMPQTDGIALSQFLYENYPQIKIIMLTGYADFTYAQSAIHYQVVDFIVKPTSKDKLIAAVKKAQELILKEHKAHSSQNLDLAFLREQLLLDLAEHTLEEDTATQKAEQYQLATSAYLLTAYQIDQEDIGRLHENFSSIKSLVLQSSQETCCCRYHNQLLLAYYPCSDSEELLPAVQETLTIADQLYGIHLTAGISLPVQGPSQFFAAFTQALHALSLTFYKDCRLSIYEPQSSNLDLAIVPAYLSYLYELENALKEWEFDAIPSLINRLFSQLRVQLIKAEDVKDICKQIHYICLLHLMKLETASALTNPSAAFPQSSSIFQLEIQVQTLVKSTCNQLLQSRSIKNPVIEQAVQYIHKNLADDLSLESISTHVHVNPSHLSRTFKKELGIPLTEYINKTRIDKAKELLQNSQSLAYEAAEQVGFKDPAYFSLTFKKYTGMTPTEFKGKGGPKQG